MKLQPDRSDAQTISGYGPGWVGVGSEKITHNVIICSRGDRIAWAGGSFEDLASVSAAVRVPVLCKDFVVDPAQVAAARAAGADAVLLMASVLGQDLPRYLDLTSRFGLEALVEVHDEAELALAVRSGARVVGVNARDLRTLAIDLERAHPLVRRAREVADVVVAESGIRSRRDVEAAARAGADAVLVGTALMGAPSPEDAVRELTGVGKENGHA
jgi:indole-3-glycerol phosphate synthase/phosphoribosylanthranilate isomerase/anthranilate synthase/indole-3-glycerol phosphate synthase/phosphoribosylanthranilate isomerase